MGNSLRNSLLLRRDSRNYFEKWEIKKRIIFRELPGSPAMNPIVASRRKGFMGSSIEIIIEIFKRMVFIK